MFKSIPIQTFEERKALCEKVGAEFHIEDMAYRVSIEEKEVGIVTFFIKGTKGCLRQIKFYEGTEDFEVMFICGRACMNFMDLVGAHDGYFISPDPQNERLTLALGYKKQPDGSWYLNTEGFFTEHCKSHEEHLDET